MKLEERQQVIRDLLEALREGGQVEAVDRDRSPQGIHGYQIPASAMLWFASDGTRAFHDPISVPSVPEAGGRTNPFFVEFYKTVATEIRGLEAHEHTAQVPYPERLDREERFRTGKLPVLFCSPTMELGVDIAELNVVNMRNVPPTPANYAQRSGRAGRSGQPALVFTYCATGSPHDQYFFKRPGLMVAGAVQPPRMDLGNEDLVRSHVHAIWLAETGQGLGTSLRELLDLGRLPELPLLEHVRDSLAADAPRQRASDRATQVLATLDDELTQCDWYTAAWIDEVLGQAVKRFDAACERWRGLFRAAVAQRDAQNRIIGDVSRSQPDKNRARQLRREAESQIDLLTEANNLAQADFYSYRYFASEGFLPGYNFPRLPLSAYLPARRSRQSRDEFVSRPRFLAITEFGPRSIVYHEGSRYQINRVILPVQEDDHLATEEAKLCPACGYLHPVPDGVGPDRCDRCDAQLALPLAPLFRLQNVSTKRREKINSDEEERRRLGYQVQTGVRFAEHGGRPSCRTATVAADGEGLAALTYGQAATLWRINLGENRRQNRDQYGFVLDIERGYWARSEQAGDEEDEPDPLTPRTRRVIPYVEDRRNALLLRFDEAQPAEVMASLQAALEDRNPGALPARRRRAGRRAFAHARRTAADLVLRVGRRGCRRAQAARRRPGRPRPGGTVEACLVARELLDRGEVRRLAVLCPPHLAEQWQAELREKFHVDAELVLPSTVTRLERDCAVGQSLFEVYPHVVVSTDLIKSDRRRGDFLRGCPELVVVDEAHTCADTGVGGVGRHQRHQLLKGLAANPDRHLILVTATPHSGKEEAFRSLLALLNPEFAALPEDRTGKEREADRRRLAAHLVQRRRADIRHYLDSDTPFPERLEKDDTYKLSAAYKALFRRVLEYARETVSDAEKGTRFRQRVRWWSALALLRSLASSPAAAATTLRSRAAVADATSPEDADEIGRRTVLDLEDDEAAERIDVTPGADPGDPEGEGDGGGLRRRLNDLAREAETLCGNGDEKLKKAVKLVAGLIQEGHHPILFCRFIATADYLARELRARLAKGVEVEAVTGSLAPAVREQRVLQLAGAPKRVLVCTDCLNEGVNLQDHFDAVVHYDLSWNPTRHEQREGRVDRYGQPARTVRVLTYYGLDNQIDGIVLDVLLRKHKAIRSSLGISVPVPSNTNQVLQAVMEGLLLRGRSVPADQAFLPLGDFEPQRDALFRDWEAASDREKRSRTVFAQETIKVDEVGRELAAVRDAIGSSVSVARFTPDALRALGAVVTKKPGEVRFDLREVPRAARELIGDPGDEVRARFELPVPEGVLYLNRTHPFVAGLGGYVMDTALDALAQGAARRCGVIRTSKVDSRTTLLLVRFRYHILTQAADGSETALLAEDCKILAFAGSPQHAEWLDDTATAELPDAEPEANVAPEQAAEFVRKVIDGMGHLRPHLNDVAHLRGQELLESHRRVRQAARQKGVRQRVEPTLPPDLLGIYVYLPKL
jgi:superfamily II DNA or RNA helicase